MRLELFALSCKIIEKEFFVKKENFHRRLSITKWEKKIFISRQFVFGFEEREEWRVANCESFFLLYFLLRRHRSCDWKFFSFSFFKRKMNNWILEKRRERDERKIKLATRMDYFLNCCFGCCSLRHRPKVAPRGVRKRRKKFQQCGSTVHMKTSLIGLTWSRRWFFWLCKREIWAHNYHAMTNWLVVTVFIFFLAVCFMPLLREMSAQYFSSEKNVRQNDRKNDPTWKTFFLRQLAREKKNCAHNCIEIARRAKWLSRLFPEHNVFFSVLVALGTHTSPRPQKPRETQPKPTSPP